MPNTVYVRVILLLPILTFLQCNSEISTANNQFGLKLYLHLAERLKKDFIISPFAINKLLGVLYNGGDENGVTKEIANLMQFLDDPEEVAADFRRVLNDFKDLESLESLDSQIFFNSSISVKANFQEKFKQFHVNPDFSNFSDANQTLMKISQWIDIKPNKNKTSQNNETLEKFLSNFDQNASMTIASRSFFKGSWVHKFSPLFTKPSPFFYDETHANLLETMFQRAQVPFAEIRELDATAVALPYGVNYTNQEDVESRLDLIILLPNSRTGLKELEDKLKEVPFSRIVSQFKDTKDLFIYLPKFNLTTWMDVSTMIADVGMPSLISDSDLHLPNMIENGTTKLSNFFHFSEISFDEFGSNGVQTSVPSPFYNYLSPETFRVNRPFIGFIYDQERYMILNIFRKTI